MAEVDVMNELKGIKLTIVDIERALNGDPKDPDHRGMRQRLRYVEAACQKVERIFEVEKPLERLKALETLVTEINEERKRIKWITVGLTGLGAISLLGLILQLLNFGLVVAP